MRKFPEEFLSNSPGTTEYILFSLGLGPKLTLMLLSTPNKQILSYAGKSNLACKLYQTKLEKL